uniref:Uncharacterized protein n=1 Tax=Anopheles epiroticus TaxID=199890 RepID=A0A182PNB5_9DIPT
MTDRPVSRLAISDPTVCYHDPNHPGPGHYDPEKPQQSRFHEKANKKPSSHLPCCYTYGQYCSEPFFRPPPGRYDLRDAQASSFGSQTRCAHQYGTVTIRLNSIDIPVRPRKGRRNMKVAFLSGSARWKDRDFFPIGGLGKATAGTRCKRSGPKQPMEHVTTSNESLSLQRGSQTSPPRIMRNGTERETEREPSPGSGSPRTSPAMNGQLEAEEEKVEGEEVNGKRVSADLVQLLVAHGITRGELPPLSKNKIPTKFFTVPRLRI